MVKDLNYLLAEFKDNILVVANGKFPTDPSIIDYIRSSNLIIACDGAIKHLNQAGLTADFVIGDGDSADDITERTAKHPYIKIPDQNTNDLTKVINFIQESRGTADSIIIIGASGLREDHSLANIALLAQYREIFPRLVMLSDYGLFQAFPSGKHHLNTVKGQQISFFCLTATGSVSCNLLKWPLQQQTFQYLNSGTLNQATSNYIDFTCDQPILVYRAFELKAN